jgi:hypothetical protein
MIVQERTSYLLRSGRMVDVAGIDDTRLAVLLEARELYFPAQGGLS